MHGEMPAERLGKNKAVQIYASVKNVNAVRGNRGDLFGYDLLRRFLDLLKSDAVMEKIGVSDAPTQTYFALVGSILQNLKASPFECIVVGPGLISDRQWRVPANLRLVGVRGPLTVRNLLNVEEPPEVISDPGLLISRFHRLPHVDSKKPLGFIIHSVDRATFFQWFPDARTNLIDNYASMEEMLASLAKYEIVLSSSLHGVIFCHAFGIPVVPIRITEQITGGEFKYRDYFLSLGKEFKSRLPITSGTVLSQLANKAWAPPNELVHKLQARQAALITEQLTNYLNTK